MSHQAGRGARELLGAKTPSVGATVIAAAPGVQTDCLWQPTPPANRCATFTFYQHVLPFAMVTSTQFLPPPPPTLTSTRYVTDFNEVKLLGSVNSATRPAEMMLWAPIHAGVTTQIGFFHVWNRIAADVAQQSGLSLIETARTFVLLTVGLHDGLQTSFTSKFTYGYPARESREDDRECRSGPGRSPGRIR